MAALIGFLIPILIVGSFIYGFWSFFGKTYKVELVEDEAELPVGTWRKTKYLCDSSNGSRWFNEATGKRAFPALNDSFEAKHMMQTLKQRRMDLMNRKLKGHKVDNEDY